MHQEANGSHGHQDRYSIPPQKPQCICRASARPPAFLSTMPHIPSSLDGMQLMEP